jgi:hypothetical protein
MSHTDAKFEKVSRSETALHGPRKLLLCGFGAGAQEKLKKVLTFAGLSDVPRIWAAADQAETLLSELMALPEDTGEGIGSSLPRAIVVGGITEKELQRLMMVCRKSGMKQLLWAALTPTSEGWPLKRLLDELAAERRAMGKKGRRR